VSDDDDAVVRVFGPDGKDIGPMTRGSPAAAFVATAGGRGPPAARPAPSPAASGQGHSRVEVRPTNERSALVAI